MGPRRVVLAKPRSARGRPDGPKRKGSGSVVGRALRRLGGRQAAARGAPTPTTPGEGVAAAATPATDGGLVAGGAWLALAGRCCC